MVGDDANRAPSQVQQALDAPKQALQLGIDRPGERRSVGDVVVAPLVDLARLYPASGVGAAGHLRAVRREDLVAPGGNGFAQAGGVGGAGLSGGAVSVGTVSVGAGFSVGTGFNGGTGFPFCRQPGAEVGAERASRDLVGDGRDRRLAGGRHGRERGPSVVQPGLEAFRFQPLRQASAQLVAQAVHEHDAFVRAGLHGGLVCRARERGAVQQRLEGAGAGIHPRLEQVANDGGDDRLVPRRDARKGFPGSGVSAPSLVGVGVGSLRRRVPADGGASRFGQSRQRLQELGDRRPAQRRPQPLPPWGMLLLQLGHGSPGLVGRKRGDGRQLLPGGRLHLVVQVGPAFGFQGHLARRTAPLQDLDDACVNAGRLREPVPYDLPPPRSPPQPDSGDHVRVALGIELQFAAAAVAKRAPAFVAQAVSRALGVRHPPQDVALQVRGQQLSEIVRIPATAFESGKWKHGDFRQGARQRPVGRLVAGDLQAQRRLGTEERRRRPRPSVGVVPQGPPIHEFHERLHVVWAVGTRPKVLALDPRQVEDGHGNVVGVGGLVAVAGPDVPSRRREGAVHDAAEPDGGAGAGAGVVLSQHEYFRGCDAKGGQQAVPFLPGVGPQDGGWFVLTVRRRASIAKALDKAVQHSGRHPLARRNARGSVPHRAFREARPGKCSRGRRIASILRKTVARKGKWAVREPGRKRISGGRALLNARRNAWGRAFREDSPGKCSRGRRVVSILRKTIACKGKWPVLERGRERISGDCGLQKCSGTDP